MARCTAGFRARSGCRRLLGQTERCGAGQKFGGGSHVARVISSHTLLLLDAAFRYWW